MKPIHFKILRVITVAVLGLSARAHGDSPAPDLRLGLESYWPLNDDMNDWLTGTAGVETGGAIADYGPGMEEDSLIADTPEGEIALIHPATLGGGSLSGSFWFTPYDLGLPGQILLQDGAAWSLHRNADTDELALSAAGVTLALPGDWEDGGWHHLAFSLRSGGSLVVWVDGAPAGEIPAGTLLASSGTLSVGVDPANLVNRVGLSLDEIALWTRELTAAELELLNDPDGGNLASELGPAPADYVRALLTLVQDPTPKAMLTWPMPAEVFDDYEIEASNDLKQWGVLGIAVSGYLDPIPATPDAKRFYRVYRKIER